MNIELVQKINIKKANSIKNKKDLNNKNEYRMKNSFDIYDNNKNKNFKNKLINLKTNSNNKFLKNRVENNNMKIYNNRNNVENNKCMNYKKNNFIYRNNNNNNKISLSVGMPNKNIKKTYNNNIKDINQIKKEKLKSKINIFEQNIISLEKILKLKNRKLLELKLGKEKNYYENKLLNLKSQYNFVIQKYQKKIKTLKIKLNKCEKQFINLNIYDETLYNEDLIFQNDKIKLLEKLMEYRELLSHFNNSNEDSNEGHSNVIKDYSSDDKTIRESSFYE